jgi:hypothetical protein
MLSFLGGVRDSRTRIQAQPEGDDKKSPEASGSGSYAYPRETVEPLSPEAVK